MFKCFSVLIVAAFLSFLFTPIVIRIAKRFEVYDIPRERRIHKVPIPLLGGVAISFSFFITLIIFGLIDRSMLGLLLGGLFILLVGIIDDVVELKPSIKFLSQIIAAVILVISGISIEFITKPFTKEMVFIGKLSIPLTIVWVVAFTNVVNFIDGLDGLASGVSAIAATTIGFVAITKGNYNIALTSFALAGAAIGFLKYNFNPAKIFMGDTGAMFLGYMISSISVLGAYKETATLTFVVPALVLGIPILDTFCAIFRRVRNHTSVSVGDKKHIHHRLLEMGMSQKQAVLTIYSGTVIFGMAAVYLVIYDSAISYIAMICLFIGAFVLSAKIGLLSHSKKDTDVIKNSDNEIKRIED